MKKEMGKGFSKDFHLEHIEEQPTTEPQKNVDTRIKGNHSRQRIKKNSYTPYPDKNFPKTADEIDDQKTGEVQSNPSKKVEDENTFLEDDGDDSYYEAVDPDANPSCVDGSGSNDQYENMSIEDDGRKSLKSAAYENVQFHQGHLDAEAQLSIRRYYRELKERIPVADVCDDLISGGVLMDEDYQDVMSYTQLRSADRFLQILLRKSQSAYEVFLLALQRTGYQDLAEKLKTNAATLTERPCMRMWNKKNVFTVWPKIKEFLIMELSPEYILDFFMQENILSVDEYEVIFHCMGNRKKMAMTFAETIQEKLPGALFVLVYALEESHMREAPFIVKQLEEIINNKSSLENVLESNSEEEFTIIVSLKTVRQEPCTVKVPPVSATPRYSIVMGLKKDRQTVATAEVEIDKLINNADSTLKLQTSLKQTDCKIIYSEIGCVIINLWPQSKYAYQKLSEFCKKGEMEKFVFDLLNEKDIVSSLPDGELCIEVKVNYQEEEPEIEEAGEPQMDLIQILKDNCSFLRQEIEVQALIGECLKSKMLTKMFEDQEISELKTLLVKNRLEAADYFLKCLINGDPKRIQSFMDTLEEKERTKIFERLLKPESTYRNSQAIKENVIHYYELVVDEIDPSQFEDTFVDREILDKKFFKDLGEKQVRRRARAASFLKEVLDKGSRALFALVDILKEMGCEELVEKLTYFEGKSVKPKQQRKVHLCNDDRKDYVNVKVVTAPTQEVLMWSCSMKVVVEKKRKDEKKVDISDVLNPDEEQIYENLLKEQTIYENVSRDDNDEGICKTEGIDIVILRPKKEMSLTNCTFKHPQPYSNLKSNGSEKEKQLKRMAMYQIDSTVDLREK